MTEETVYIRIHRGNKTEVYHTDRNCGRLANVNGVHERTRDDLPDHLRECATCSGSQDHSAGSGNRTHYNALKKAAEGN